VVDRNPDYFGEEVAARYDAGLGERGEPGVIAATVDFLADLAGDGAALELGIGTGRIALPLAERGVPVHGIDLSEAMVAQLRTKPGGEALPVTIGDFAMTRVDGTFSLAYVVFNTIMNLTTQEDQVACFENVARHLRPGGCFVVSAWTNGSLRRSGSCPITSRSWTGAGYATRSRSTRPPRASTTSWPVSPACGCANGGAAGSTSRSPTTA
jgi:SAM-dependent methyltransferase